jgi:hypothetical protein
MGRDDDAGQHGQAAQALAADKKFYGMPVRKLRL